MPKGFIAFNEGEEESNPSKKIKKDYFTPRFSQI